MISKALHCFQISKFIKAIGISRFSKLLVHIAELQRLFRTENRTPEYIKSAWKCSKNEINEFNEADWSSLEHISREDCSGLARLDSILSQK